MSIKALCPLLLFCFLPVAPSTLAAEMPLIKEVSPDVVEVGAVKVEKSTRTVTIPASVNLREGLLEYFLVEEQGKSHESLLVSRTQPYHIHIAMLLLGAKNTEQPAPPPPGQLDNAYLANAPKLAGDDVTITVSWVREGKTERLAAEELIANTQQGEAPLAKGPWLYNGSFVSNGNLNAQVEGSVIALVTDASALINNPRPGARDDSVWIARTAKLPPVGTPVEIAISLNPSK